MSKPPKARFVLHVEAQKRPGGDDDGVRRLKAILKLMIRTFGFRVTNVERLKEPTGEER